MSKISDVLKQEIFQEFGNRCAYCHMPAGLVKRGQLTIEHIQPVSQGGGDERENLCPACYDCNNRKSDKTTGIDPITGNTVPLFNPRKDRWSDHFEFKDGGERIEGKTPIGRATVNALGMNDTKQCNRRKQAIRKGLYPPPELLL